MFKTIGKTSLVLAFVVVAGCSSTRQGTTRVSYVEPAYTSTTYQYTDSTYHDTKPAYDREYGTTRTTAVSTPSRESTTTYTRSPGMTARTVSMPGGNVRHDITLGEFRDHVKNQTAVIVDAREPKHFTKGHVRGAINIPAGDESAYLEKFRKDVSSDELIIVYCGGPDCPAGDNVANYLTSNGFTNVRVYTPGWQELSKSDLR